VSAPRAAIYARVSRSDQRIDLQIDECTALAARRGWRLAKTYADHGATGRNDKRPELRRMLADARAGRFGVLIVWRFDRLFRSTQHLLSVVSEFEARGIAFASVCEAWDTSTPQGQLMLTVVAAFAQFERQIIVERCVAGQEAARRRGKLPGRRAVRRELSDEEIEQELAAGTTFGALAERLKCTEDALRSHVRRRRREGLKLTA
jgi:DNA invertase Pin-like site-specific DNA recombinase